MGSRDAPHPAGHRRYIVGSLRLRSELSGVHRQDPGDDRPSPHGGEAQRAVSLRQGGTAAGRVRSENRRRRLRAQRGVRRLFPGEMRSHRRASRDVHGGQSHGHVRAAAQASRVARNPPRDTADTAGTEPSDLQNPRGTERGHRDQPRRGGLPEDRVPSAQPCEAPRPGCRSSPPVVHGRRRGLPRVRPREPRRGDAGQSRAVRNGIRSHGEGDPTVHGNPKQLQDDDLGDRQQGLSHRVGVFVGGLRRGPSDERRHGQRSGGPRAGRLGHSPRDRRRAATAGRGGSVHSHLPSGLGRERGV
jgi:hypothetical protein